MRGQNESRPIVIKRRRIVAGGGHHGGAWKVAYADFVTAMMAFFLMLWLLGSTTDDQRKGLADYFSPTVPVHRVSGGGDGLDGGDTVIDRRHLAGDHAQPAVDAAGPGGGAPDAPSESEPPLETIEALLNDAASADAQGAELLRHLLLRITEDGLQIEVFDLDDSPLFAPGTAEPMPVLQALGGLLAEVLGLVSNPITLDGHVRAHAVVEREDRAWDLSMSRPQTLRQLLEDGGIMAQRFRHVTGHGDRQPVTGNPVSPRNNRVVLLLRTPDRARRVRPGPF
ncbi:MAG: chemotaxis protein MotB [Rhodobacteraceae bacterium]|nr:chemotaxis protein MotB [Paracoccaceae bacterium]